ncbi:MAG: hypothetical protein Q8880_09840, partial [Bacteroidota bacterium]|nr:hypothetical protein [Bacteroidota bacterium]
MLKKFLFHSKFSIIILLFFLSYSSFSQIEPHRNFIEKLASYDMKSNKARFAMTPSTQDMSYDLKYERIYLELNPEVYYVKGNVTFYYIKTSGAEDTINFDLHSSLEADSVCYHGSKCSFLHKGDILSIFGIKSNIGRIDSLTVYYRGIPEKKGFGSFTQGLHADSSIVWTLSEP